MKKVNEVDDYILHKNTQFLFLIILTSSKSKCFILFKKISSCVCLKESSGLFEELFMLILIRDAFKLKELSELKEIVAAMIKQSLKRKST